VLPTVGAVFLAIFIIIFWVSSRSKPSAFSGANLPPGMEISNIRKYTQDQMESASVEYQASSGGAMP
jgi:hypothetical protein